MMFIHSALIAATIATMLYQWYVIGLLEARTRVLFEHVQHAANLIQMLAHQLPTEEKRP